MQLAKQYDFLFKFSIHTFIHIYEYVCMCVHAIFANTIYAFIIILFCNVSLFYIILTFYIKIYFIKLCIIQILF